MYKLEIEDTSKLFFTSDTHFSHFNICKYCERPYESRSEMDNALIENWNKIVPPDGITVHCGDFMLDRHGDIENYLKYARKLNGTILLIRGNHDRIQLSLEQHENILAIVDAAYICTPFATIYAQHFPCLAFRADYQVFGHLHTLKDGLCHGSDAYANSLIQSNQYDVGVDQNDYLPISYEQFIEKVAPN